MPKELVARDRFDLRRSKEAELRKLAEENDGQGRAFEKAMGDVVHLVLKDRVPKLMDYEVGFRLVDRDTEANKAAGATVFKIGAMVVIAPAFFIEGQVKGTEILYIKKSRQAVPAQAAWVDFLIERADDELGSPMPHAARSSASGPDLWRLARPPMKYAAHGPVNVAAEIAEILPHWARMALAPCFQGVSSYPLMDFVKEGGAPALRGVAACCATLPHLAIELERRRGFSVWDDLVKAAGGPDAAENALRADVTDSEISAPSLLRARPSPRGKRHPAPTPDKVQERAMDRSVPMPHLTEAERSLFNPDATGLYDVMTRPTVYEKCLVSCGGWTASNRVPWVTVVRLSDGHFWNVSRRLVHCGQRYSKDDFRKWFDGLPAADKAGVGDKLRIAIDPLCNATAPFQITDDIGPADGGKWMRVRFDLFRDDDRDYRTRQLGALEYGAVPRDFCGAGEMLLGSARGSTIFTTEGTLVAPAGTKALAVTPQREHGSTALGGPIDVHMDLVTKTAAVRVMGSGSTFVVDGGGTLSRREAFRALTKRGMETDAASAALNAAAALGGRREHVARYKRAAGQGHVRGPGFPEPMMTSEQGIRRTIPAMPRQMWFQRIEDMREPEDSWQRRDPRDVSVFGQAKGDAARGVIARDDRDATTAVTQSEAPDELFDMGMIAAALSTTQPDLQVDRHIGPLKRALTALADILMSSLWHSNDFEERYGKHDAVSLEDMLRNSFLNLGKLVLNLQKKAVGSPVDLDGGYDVDVQSNE